MPLETDLGFCTQNEIMGGWNETLVNDVQVIPRLCHFFFNRSNSAVVTTTTEINNAQIDEMRQ